MQNYENSVELRVYTIVALITSCRGILYKFHDRSNKTYQQNESDSRK